MPTREEYNARCEERWHSWALRDAKRNFDSWEELRPQFEELISSYLRDCWARDLSGKCHNSPGTLTGYCWMVSASFADEPGQLGRLLDFNDDSQTVFLRRGLIVYLALMIRDREARVGSEPTMELPLG